MGIYKILNIYFIIIIIITLFYSDVWGEQEKENKLNFRYEKKKHKIIIIIFDFNIWTHARQTLPEFFTPGSFLHARKNNRPKEEGSGGGSVL